MPASAPAPHFQPPGNQQLQVKDAAGEVNFTGPRFSLRFDKKSGTIAQYRYKGVTVLERGPLPDFWRAPTNNDRGAWKDLGERAARNRANDIFLWRDAGPRWQVRDVRVESIDDARARVTVAADLPVVGATYSMTYTIHGSGDVLVECAYKPGADELAMMPRFGTELIAAPGLENIAWYGRGPHETQIDRQFERVGVYHSTVDKEWVEYMRPQENGNKTGVRWVILTNAQGVGIMAVGAPVLEVGARHYSKSDMEHAGYTFQMQRHPEVFLNLDWKQMGAGGIDSWSQNAYPMAKYRIPSGEAHAFHYRLSPVDAATAIAKKAHERF